MRDINIHGVYIQVWGNDTKGGNGFTQIINSYLFGTASGHASITLIIPANEEGCSLIQKYCDNKETDSCSGQNAIIPYDKFSILLPSGDVKEVFQVRFSWWNDENAPFYLSPSLEIEAAQLNRKKSFNWKENFLSYIDPEPDLLVGISGETHILKGPERIDILPIDDTLKEILVLDREIYLLNNKIMIIQSVIESINKQEIGNVRIRRKEKVQINRIFKDEIISDINLSRENAEILGKNLSDKMNELLLSRDEKQEKKDTLISNIPSLKEEVDKHNNMLDKLAFIENMYNEVRDKIIKNDFSSDKNFQYAYIWHFLDSEGYLGEYYEKIYDNEAFKKLEKYLQVAIKDQLKKINLQRIKCANLSLFKEKNDITGVSRYQGFMVENEVFLPSNVNSINGVSRESINIENMLKAMREIVDNKKFDAAEYNCSSVVCNILEAGFPEDLKPIAQERMLGAFLTPSLIYNIAREARQYYIDSEYKPKKRLIISPIARITIKIAQIIFDNKQNLFIRVFFGLIALTLLLFKGVYEYIKQVLSNPIGYIEATIDVFILLKEKKAYKIRWASIVLSIPLLLICAIPASIQYICRYFFKLLSRISNEETLIELNNMHESGNDVINNDDDRVSYINGKIVEIDINDVTEALKKFIHIIATKESDIPILSPKLIERIYTECEADIVNEEIINYIVEEKLWKYMPLLEQSNFKQSEPSRFVHSTNDIDEDTIRDKISKLTIGDLVQRLCDCSNVRVKLANEEYNQKNFDRVYDIPNNKDKVIQKLNEQKLIFSCDSVIEKSDPDSGENVVASSSMTRKSKG